MSATLTLRTATAILVVAATAGIGLTLVLRPEPATPTSPPSPAILEVTDATSPVSTPSRTPTAPVTADHNHDAVQPTPHQAGDVAIEPPAVLTASDRTQAATAATAVAGWIDTWTADATRPPPPPAIAADSWLARIPITAPPPPGTTRHPDDISTRVGAADPTTVYVHTSWRPVDRSPRSTTHKRGPWRRVVVELSRSSVGWQAVNVHPAVPLNAAHHPAVPG